MQKQTDSISIFLLLNDDADSMAVAVILINVIIRRSPGKQSITMVVDDYVTQAHVCEGDVTL